MQPSFRINSNGNDITQVVGDRLLSVKVTDQAGQKSDTCEITIDDRGQQLALPEIGTQLEVFLGYESLTKWHLCHRRGDRGAPTGDGEGAREGDVAGA